MITTQTMLFKAGTSKNILLDSDFLFAYILEPDPNHTKAVKLFNEYAQKARWFILTPTLGEFLTVLSNKASQTIAKHTYFLIDNLNIAKIFPQEYFWNLAFEIFLQSTKKRTSIIDCLNLAYFKYSDLGFWAIASFDKFYGKDRLKEK